MRSEDPRWSCLSPPLLESPTLFSPAHSLLLSLPLSCPVGLLRLLLSPFLPIGNAHWQSSGGGKGGTPNLAGAESEEPLCLRRPQGPPRLAERASRGGSFKHIFQVKWLLYHHAHQDLNSGPFMNTFCFTLERFVFKFHFKSTVLWCYSLETLAKLLPRIHVQYINVTAALWFNHVGTWQ